MLDYNTGLGGLISENLLEDTAIAVGHVSKQGIVSCSPRTNYLPGHPTSMDTDSLNNRQT